MEPENHFNLIDEPWIPVVDVGRVSLRQIFTQPEYRALGGNPVEKIAITKLLLAIAQSAATPADDEAWATMGVTGLAGRCIEYLEKWHDRFWLYGERPFLQTKNLMEYKTQPIGAIVHGVATGNTTVLNQSQIRIDLTDSEWALALLVDQNFSVKHNLAYGALTKPGQKGKGKATKSGPALGPTSYMHNFVTGKTLLETILFNVLTIEMIDGLPFEFSHEQSKPVWEIEIYSRDDNNALMLSNSYIGRLCPLSRFISRESRFINYCEGIVYASHADGGREVSVAYGMSKKGDAYAVNVKTSMRPWRELPSLLAFFDSNSNSNVTCIQLKLSLMNGRIRNCSNGFAVWSGGVLMRGDSYSQFAKSDDDYIEASTWFENKFFTDPSCWLSLLHGELLELDKVKGILRRSVYDYHKREVRDSTERDKRADAISHNSITTFWQLCDRIFQDLVDACYLSDSIPGVRQQLKKNVNEVFNTFCPRDTARQLDAWAKCRPNLAGYIN